MKKVSLVITNIEERKTQEGNGTYFHITSRAEDGLRVGLNLNANVNSIEVIKNMSAKETIELNIDEEKISTSSFNGWTGKTITAKLRDNFEILKSYGFEVEKPLDRFLKSMVQMGNYN